MILKKNIIEIDDNSITDEIDSIDYMNLIDMNIKESVHKRFLQDFSDYTNYIKAVETASMRTLDAVGGKSINKMQSTWQSTQFYFYTKLNTLPNIVR